MACTANASSALCQRLLSRAASISDGCGINIASLLAGFRTGDQVLQPREFGGADVFLFQQIQREQFRRVAKKPADDMPHGAAACLFSAYQRVIDKSASSLGVPEVAFFLQDSHG